MTKDVIVLHGIAMNRGWMAGMARHLKAGGYRVHSVSYPSRDKGFDALVDEHIAPLVDKIGGKVNFVTHSMGGILVRRYAQKYGAEKIGRVVMIGTPNRGSEVADFLRHKSLYKWYFGEAGQGLGTSPGDVHASLPPIDFDCGVIAGENHYLHFPASYIVDIPRPNDGLVSVESTKVEGLRDHVTVFGDHSLLVWMPSVWKLTLHFLDTGRFKA